jgi:hypothetical protein
MEGENKPDFDDNAKLHLPEGERGCSEEFRSNLRRSSTGEGENVFQLIQR